MWRSLPAVFLLAFSAVAGWSCGPGDVPGYEPGIPAGAEPFYEFNWADMADQPKLKPQRTDLFGPNPVGMRKPPEGTVALDQFVYPFVQDEAEKAALALRNPYKNTPERILKGKTVFENVCIVCHGKQAAGDGNLTQLFPKPPHLMRKRVRDYTDARIFHVPMRGQASMPSHSTQLEPEDLWSVVHYIRNLQATLPVAPPTEADLTFWEAERKAAEEAARKAAEDAAEDQPALQIPTP